MSWQARFRRRANRDLDRMPDTDREAMLDAIEQAAQDPGSVDFRKLRGSGNLWRVRSGRWRAIIELDNNRGVMFVTRILPRDQAYR